MKDNEITSFDKELNKFLQPKCLIPSGLGRCYEIINIYKKCPVLNWAFCHICIELMLYVSYII